MVEDSANVSGETLLCSECFSDEGLRLAAEQIGAAVDSECHNCHSRRGYKLGLSSLEQLARRFFVRGTIEKAHFGAAPSIQFNTRRSTSITVQSWTEPDLRLLEKTLGVGFFLYGPRLWMLGEVEPLKSLQTDERRQEVLKRIVSEYPVVELQEEDRFYRLRSQPQDPLQGTEYDSPPISGKGRLDSSDLPVLYASQDVQVCVHECRIAVDDESYIATIAPARRLRVLDLTALLDEDVTEFESLDLAIHMVFLAGAHAYEITRAIARAALQANFDGVIYPSYFSLIRTGGMPFDTIYGISIRRIPQLKEHAKAQMIQNIAIFGRPIKEGILRVACINKLVIGAAQYSLVFGPVGYDQIQQE